MALTVAEIAERLGAELEGDGSAEITGVAGIREAETGDISFVANKRYAVDAEVTSASAIIVGKDWDKPCPGDIIRVDNPDAAFASIAGEFAPEEIEFGAGVHSSAVVDPSVELGAGVYVGPCCVIEAGAVIGANTVLVACCYVGHNVRVGADCKLYSNISIRENCILGDRVIIHNNAVIGSDGFGYTVDKEGVRKKIPQIGIVVIGDDAEVGANATIDRARFGKTRIGKGVKIDNQVQVAHNVVIDDHAVIIAQVGIAGSTMIGKHAILAGQAGVAGHLVVGDGAIVGGSAGVTKDVPPKTFVSGFPAIPHGKSQRLLAHIAKLPELSKRVAELEARLGKSEADTPSN